jgi:trigger factor
MVEGLDEALQGMSAGESKTFASTLVGGGHEGEAADITVTVQKVQERVLPEVDDEFAHLVSEYDTVDEMLAGLSEGLERMAKMEQADEARDKVLDAVIEATQFDLPEDLTEREFEARKEQIETQLSQAGLTVEDYLTQTQEEDTKDPDEFWAELRKNTQRGLRAQIILDKLADDQQAGISQEDLSELLMQKAAQNGTSPEQEANHMIEHNHTAEWMGEIRRGKALGSIVDQATVTDTDGNKVDLSQLRSDGTEADSPDSADSPEQAKPAKKAKAKKKSE